MKQSIVLEDVRLFGVKPLGNGCRFGIKINSKQQDGNYSKGIFLNCKHKEVLTDSQMYTLSGFLTTNVWNDNETLEFVVMTATPQGAVKTATNKQPSSNINVDEDIPF